MNSGLVALASPRVSICGDSALLLDAEGPLELTTQQRIWALSAQVAGWDRVVDVQPGMNNLLVVVDPAMANVEELQSRLLSSWKQTTPSIRAGKLLEVRVAYGGEAGIDMPEVAAKLGMSAREIAELHASAEYVVFAPGTGPGFGYLYGLPPRLFTPRRQVPVPRKSDGAILIAGAQSNLRGPRHPARPEQITTGWYLLGRALDVPPPFDLGRDPPNLLTVGDRIRFSVDRVD